MFLAYSIRDGIQITSIILDLSFCVTTLLANIGFLSFVRLFLLTSYFLRKQTG